MIDKFLSDQQDPKAIEKVYSRLVELLPPGEDTLYIATQKKPLVNLLPDCVAITNRRILFFTPANLGLSIKFIDFVWKDIADVNVKEEIIGAVFSARTTKGAEMGVDYLPKVQARKLYQYAQECKENERRQEQKLREEQVKQTAPVPPPPAQPVPPAMQAEPVPTPVQVSPPAVPAKEEKPDELTEKLKKLKMLFDNSLITQEEYNQKKMELLSEL